MYNFSIPGEEAAQAKNNGGIFPKFYMRAVPDGQASRNEGRPIFKEVEWITMYIAGDKTSVPSMKVTDEHRKRWPDHYKAFKEGQTAPTVGTPISQWPALTVSQVEEFKALRIYTVEQLAEMSDAGLQSLGLGGRSLQAKAKAYLEAAKGSAIPQKYAEENERLKAELARQNQLIQDLATELKAFKENQPKRGRTKKSVQEAVNAA